jgi:CheY-like chemotaxis protein
VRVLSDQHDVVTETDAAVALARIARGETFDVIFCDLMMPNMGGVDVHAALFANRPDLARRLVFLTGGAFSQRTEEFLETVANPVVAKPFTVEGLRALVADYVS